MIPVDERNQLEGFLSLPLDGHGLIIFAHSSAKSHLSQMNQYVAQMFHADDFGTLLVDLLTPEEDEHYSNRFYIDFLSDRLVCVTKWIKEQPFGKDILVGYFGAGAGVAAAVEAAIRLGCDVRAIVSRGGRPDMAKEDLPKLKSPILLFVGGRDIGVLELNEDVWQNIKTKKQLRVIPGATNMFEEEVVLQEVTEQASEWFKKYLR
jgi:hypothetical protein